MSFRRFELLAGLFGVVVPIIFRALWYVVDWSQTGNYRLQMFFQKIMLMFWPTSILSLPASDVPGFELTLFILAVISNILIYLMLGALIWLGVKTNLMFLGLAGIIISVIWWRLLML